MVRSEVTRTFVAPQRTQERQAILYKISDEGRIALRNLTKIYNMQAVGHDGEGDHADI
jgi:hypothetical protein